MPMWNEIEGETLTSNLTLQKLLRSEGRTAWFATTDREGQAAVVSVFEALNDEDAVVARLEAAARVRHANLLVIRRTGTARLDDESLVYAVMEPYEQTLAEVLQERPLTTEETRDVAENLLSALEAVEAAGLYHGHVDAAGVLAVGDSIKLRSDCLTPRQRESDAPGLAALIYNALTGRRLTSDRDAAQLPAPFAALVRAGSGSGGSLAAMRRVLTGPVVTSAAAASVAASTGSGLTTASGSARATSTQPASAVPPTVSSAGRDPVPGAGIPRAALGEEEPVQRKHRPGVSIAALVLMAILLGAFWYAFKRPAGHTPIDGEARTAVAPNAPTQATAAPAITAPSNPSPAGTSPNAAEQAAASMGAPSENPTPEPARRSAPAIPTTDTAIAPRGVWHVVVYTYGREDTAQHKAAELATRYPQMEPQVFSPSGHAPYLVVLGAGMDRQDALARRDAARAAGMPRDTYAQNYKK